MFAALAASSSMFQNIPNDRPRRSFAFYARGSVYLCPLMNKTSVIDIIVTERELHNDALLRKSIAAKTASFQIDAPFRILRKSLDARQKTIKYNLRIEFVGKNQSLPPRFTPRVFRPLPSNAPQAVVVGAGPAGLFAALRLIEHGVKPVVIERGKDVRTRRRDLAALTRDHVVNPDSNYCFGEGGAGTYSDGKLYTRSTKRGDVVGILETLVQFGADENILIEAHPHIGTNKLPGIIAQMREAILHAGGEVRFDTKLTDILVDDQHRVRAAVTAAGEIPCDSLVLATGHSARDIFYLFDQKKWSIEFKSFALGVRAEHPQQLVDSIQYHCEVRPEALPPAAYALVHQVEGRGVYSFCMCPGGIIAPCATDTEEIVTNGWSPSKRNNPYANSGIVVPVLWEDIPKFHAHGALAGLEFQKSVERACWLAGGKTQAAPAQRLVDFIAKKTSSTLPPSSYTPGLVSVNLYEVLPPFVAETLRQGFIAFDKKMKGYAHPDAVLVATESRTSSPVRIPRDADSLEHPQIKGLYPCGEGAGYAGGIVSAAIDGDKVAVKIADRLLQLQP